MRRFALGVAAGVTLGLAIAGASFALIAPMSMATIVLALVELDQPDE